MVDRPEASESTDPLARKERIDDIADQYEAAWKKVGPPRLADFLGNATGEFRAALLDELIKVDRVYRERLAAPPDVAAPVREVQQPAPAAPTPFPADRNLLFGILALQMDFIRRDALIAAMHAWVRHNGSPRGVLPRKQTPVGAAEQPWPERRRLTLLPGLGCGAARRRAACASAGWARPEREQIAPPIGRRVPEGSSAAWD